jgi:assimilatory nitrate reductase catalytic subunit
MTGVRLSTSVEPERLVKTHCCFCGQQCGIQLKVRENQVIGFEPWEEFPVQQGHALPEGREALPSGLAPDRLTTASVVTHRRRLGFSSMPYKQAIARVAVRDQPDSADLRRRGVGVLGGASLTTEKTYLLGKFARVCLKTPFIDYNGRLCMVSAGAANKKAFGIDRTTNPWSDMVGTDVIWVAGSNVAECSPITDQLHLAGARAGREDHHPGSAHHAGRPHLRSVSAGEARPGRGALCRRAADHDRA